MQALWIPHKSPINNMTKLVLIRHGQTDWNVEGRYQGQADPPLNANGIEQAEALARLLMDTAIEVLYSSPLKRALQTAEILSRILKVPVIRDPRLMEINQGEWETRLRSDIERSYPERFYAWQKKPWEVTPPGGENLSEVQGRVYSAIDEILREQEYTCIGLVTHRIPIALIKMRYQRLDPDIVRTIDLPNTYWEIIHIPENRSTKKRCTESHDT